MVRVSQMASSPNPSSMTFLHCQEFSRAVARYLSASAPQLLLLFLSTVTYYSVIETRLSFIQSLI